MPTKTIDEKIEYQQQAIDTAREEIDRLQKKINRHHGTMTKLMEEKTTDAYDVWLNESDPLKIDWEYAASNAAGSPQSRDYNAFKLRLNELFGYNDAYGMDINRYTDYDKNGYAKNHWWNFQLKLLAKDGGRECDPWDDDEYGDYPEVELEREDRDDFARSVGIAVAVTPTLREQGVKKNAYRVPSYETKKVDVQDYVKIDIFDRDCSESGIPYLFVKKDLSSFVFGMMVYGSMRFSYECETLDEMIAWMAGNGKTYEKY